ncbi:MAG: glycosyltransferase [Candidatus Omnitrophica bacterium]|nr:glycosyltransferase [Candidatus Omnitrophota bacterium]
MKIGVDIQSTQGQKTGIGYYTENLLKRLRKRPEVSFCLYRHPSRNDLDTLKRIKWENADLPHRSRKDRVDILHVPGFAGPRTGYAGRKVTTVHDLIGLIYPGNLGTLSRFYWKRWLPFCVRSSDLIISVSEHTKKDITRLLGIPGERIRVVHSAAEARFSVIQESRDKERVRRKYGLPARFVMTAGTVEPRKNIPGLIEAFAAYIGKSETDLSLVIVGKKGWGYAEAEARARELDILQRVVFTDYAEDADLPLLYNLAEFFIMPSFYEGFGLPVLEAMSCGKAVICSDVSSLPEIAGESALFVAPDDLEAMSEAIADLDRNRRKREKFSRLSLSRAGEFSWERTARETMRAYMEVSGRG